MLPAYDEKEEKLYLIHKRSQHAPPLLHESLEFIHVTDGSLALGIEQEFFSMEQGDFALIFPNVIHHYQVFSPGKTARFMDTFRYRWPGSSGLIYRNAARSCRSFRKRRFTG